MAEKLDVQLDRNQEERVDGVSEELMGEGGQEGCRSCNIQNTVKKM